MKTSTLKGMLHMIVEDNKKTHKQITTKKAPHDGEARQKSAKKCEHKEKNLLKAPTKLENKEKREKAGQQKKYNLKEKPVDNGQSKMMQQLSNAVVQKGHLSDVEPSNSSDLHNAHMDFQNLQLIQKANNDLCAPLFSPTVPLENPDRDILVSDASIIVEKDEHHEDQLRSVTKKDHSMPSYSLGLGLSQPDSQSPVPQNTSMLDPSTATVNENDGIEDDDDSPPFRIPLSAKKPYEKKPKEGDEPAFKKGEVASKGLKMPVQSKQGSSSRSCHKMHKVVKAKLLTKLDSELFQNKLTISDEPCLTVAAIRRLLRLLWSL
ncbi:hypothetical protein Cgig2_021601 [Carnegiea gigantea]|uniref:Uncharacterized protein n=1 Tax=Carnegiea gigantea TaxID=171969 RepID=A0A9Q1GHC2_9CARY|nr:hypothetical protein Cgig2_021601 [Carnegiea gigantea]